MFDSVALNVVIGLVFIFLLYSLLATVISELIATGLGLRARNLKEAIDRMLNDEKETGPVRRFWDSLKFLKNPDNKVVSAFYNQPEIKYLGSSGLFKIPSFFKSENFSKTVLTLLFGSNVPDKKHVEARINEIIELAKNENKEARVLDPETAEYIKSLWLEAKGDVEKFKKELEHWFDRTMEHTAEWYKRKIRAVLLILGFCLAWFFNADTFVIVKKLSTDRVAREQLVSMANSYIQNSPMVIDTSSLNHDSSFKEIKARMDSLLIVKQQLESDITDAGNILGTGCWPSGPQYSFSEKLSYMFGLLGHHFFGFLVTAIAISLGAPFWFDLLNKITQLRTTKKMEAAVPDEKAKT
jgi:hypothetical protein